MDTVLLIREQGGGVKALESMPDYKHASYGAKVCHMVERWMKDPKFAALVNAEADRMRQETVAL